MKKIIWILLIVIIAGVLAGGTYWYFEKQQNGPNDGGSLSVGDLFPFGRGGGDTSGDNSRPAPIVATSTPPAPAPLARVWKISNDPQSGAGIFLRNNDTFVRFVDTATGNIFENKLGERDLTRVTNTTIPKIRTATWSQKGDATILRYVTDNDSVQTLYGKLAPMAAGTTTETTDVQELDSSFLASNIIDLAVFGPKDKLFYVARNNAGNAVAFTSNLDGTKSVRLFETPIREWSVSWPQESTVVVTTKPSALADGFSYLVSTKTGALQKFIGGVHGLAVAPSFDLSHAVYSQSTASGIELRSFDTKTGSSSPLTSTFADKCVWMHDNLNVICAVPKNIPGGTYPDNWYQGKMSFADTFLMFNTNTNRSMTILDPGSLARTDIDATHLALDVSEQFLIFTNKKDGSLWALRIHEN